MANNNQNLAKQLKSLSAAVEAMEDSDLLPVILDTCSGLLQEVQKRRPALTAMDDIDRVGYVVTYTAISGLVGTFVKELQGIEGAGWDQTQLSDAMAELEEKRRSETELKNQILVVQGEVDLQKNTNDALENDVNARQKELNTLKDFHTTLQDMASACTPEIIEQQKKDNAALLSQYNQNDAQLKKLQAEEKEQSAKLQAVKDKITATRLAIEAMPEENRRLVEESDELSKTLRRIETAMEECSPEEQEKLSERIRELKPQAEKLEKDKKELEDILTQLQNTKTVLSEDKQELETNILALLESSLGQLTRLMEEHRGELVRIRQEADTYREGLEQCEQMKLGYEAWLGTNATQLKAALKVIDSEEYTNLRQTLNPNDEKKIQDMFAEVKQILEQVDRMLRRCKDAVCRDRSTVERLARG